MLIRRGDLGAQVIRRDEVSRAATLLYKVLVDRGVSWTHACTMLTETVAAAKAAAERKQVSALLLCLHLGSQFCLLPQC